jgi:hypothetical protein
LVASWRPWRTRSSLKRTSWVLDIISRPKRSASAPWASISSSGSTPVPSDLLIRRPSGACTTEWMYTSENGTSPMYSRPIITMRATQRKMMSRAVESTWVG